MTYLTITIYFNIYEIITASQEYLKPTQLRTLSGHSPQATW